MKARPFWIWQIVFLVLLAIVWNLRSGLVKSERQLPKLSILQSFLLTNQDGVVVTADDLKSKKNLVSFFYADCSHECQILNSKISALSSLVGPDVHIYSVSVDPEHDSPEKLKKYAQNYKASLGRWSFLVGQKVELDRLRQSLMLDTNTDLRQHATQVFLIDQNGVLRNAYDIEQPENMKKLIEDVKILKP